MNLYYSDLNQLQQDTLKHDWGNHGRKDLVKAVEEGKDIEIGDYCKTENCVVFE